MSTFLPAKDMQTRIDTERSVISFSTSNLLDSQIMLALKSCVENHQVNDVKLLQHLEAIGDGTFVLGKDRTQELSFKLEGKEDQIEELENQIEELEDDVEELEDLRVPSNLLSLQLKESFDAIVESNFINQIHFLNHLHKIEKLEIKLTDNE